MSKAIDIARAYMEIVTSGTPENQVIAELRARFPTATIADLKRAFQVGADQIALYLGNEEARDEAAGKAFDLMVSGAPDAEIQAAFDRLKCTPETLFPRKPRADAS
jgi:hypothetical protein